MVIAPMTVKAVMPYCFLRCLTTFVTSPAYPASPTDVDGFLIVTYSMISTISGSLSVSFVWSKLSSIRFGRPTASSSICGVSLLSSGEIVETFVSYSVVGPDGTTTATSLSAVSPSVSGSGSFST